MSKEKEIISNKTEIEDKEIAQSENKENIQSKQIHFSNCAQSNFTIISNNKSFNFPLNIEKSSLNFLQRNITEIKEKKPKKNFVPINNTSIFIGGRQNLKGMRIHLSNNFKYNNTVHKEITDFRNVKNKSVDKANVRLAENKPIEKVSINLYDQNNNKENINFNDAYKMMLIRWKNHSNIKKTSISYINKKENFVLNKNKYINEFVNKINVDLNKNKNKKNGNNQEKYILIKQDKYNKEYKFIHDIISPSSNEELKTTINNFIYKVNENKENLNNNIDESLMSTQDNYLNNGKKMSKFSNKKIAQIKNINQENEKENSSNKNNNNQFKNDDFTPIFILTEKDIIFLYELVEKKQNNKPNNNKPNNINYSIENKIFLNIIKKNDSDKLRGKAEIKQKNLDDINFNIFPVKGDKFEFINIVPNELRANYNIDGYFIE